MLKKCPFCGGRAELRGYTATLQFVQCKECLTCSHAFQSDSEAIDAWNRRDTALTRLKRRLAAWLQKS